MSDEVPGQMPPSPENAGGVPQTSAPEPQAPASVPPVGVPIAPAAGSAATAPPRRSRTWMWWTIGALVLVAVIVGSCALPFVLLFKDTSGTGSLGLGDTVAVIYIDGVIAGTGLAYDGYVTPESFKNQLDRAAEDASVKAIVLRVDSPGGTVAASEEIAAYVEAAEKPVVVSVGDVCASGAYMVSSQADEIWSMPGSAVGSIGVIAEIPNVEKLLDKVGVDFQVITAGKHKDAGSPYRPLSDEERALIQGEVDDAYDQFVGIVADGRGMPRSEVTSLATGWAWNGDTAKELGLVDQIGTFDQALDAAAKRGGITGDYQTTTYRDEFSDIFGSLLGIERELKRIGALVPESGTGIRQTLPR